MATNATATAEEPAAPAAPAPADDVKPADDPMDLGAAMLEESASPEESSTEVKETDKPAEPAAEPAKPDEGKPDEAADKPDEAETPDAEDDTAEDGKKPDEESDTDKPNPRSAEARKEKLQAEIRELVSKRKAELRSEVERRNAEAYRTETAAELEARGLDEAEVRAELAEQKLRYSEFNQQVSDLNFEVESQSLQVLQDYPVFDPESELYDEALHDRAKVLYKNVAGLEYDDKTGLLTKANVLPYEIYKSIAEAAETGISKGQVQGQRAAEKQAAAVEPAASTSSTPATDADPDDPFIQGFDRVK